MDVMQAIHTRRSVKKYKPDPVAKELVEKIAEAGTHAATGRNGQSPIILAISNRQVRDELMKLNASVMGMQGDPFYGAPVVLVVLADKKWNTYVYDGSLVMGNMMLAAQELGLGSCWIHRAKETFAMPEGKAILQKLGIEGDYEGIGNLVVGYADVVPQEMPRKANWIYYVD